MDSIDIFTELQNFHDLHIEDAIKEDAIKGDTIKEDAIKGDAIKEDAINRVPTKLVHCVNSVIM